MQEHPKKAWSHSQAVLNLPEDLAAKAGAQRQQGRPFFPPGAGTYRRAFLQHHLCWASLLQICGTWGLPKPPLAAPHLSALARYSQA